MWKRLLPLCSSMWMCVPHALQWPISNVLRVDILDSVLHDLYVWWSPQQEWSIMLTTATTLPPSISLCRHRFSSIPGNPLLRALLHDIVLHKGWPVWLQEGLAGHRGRLALLFGVDGATFLWLEQLRSRGARHHVLSAVAPALFSKHLLCHLPLHLLPPASPAAHDVLLWEDPLCRPWGESVSLVNAVRIILIMVRILMMMVGTACMWRWQWPQLIIMSRLIMSLRLFVTQTTSLMCWRSFQIALPRVNTFTPLWWQHQSLKKHISSPSPESHQSATALS